MVILFVEAKFFDDEKEAAAKRAERRQEKDAKRAAEIEAKKRKVPSGSAEALVSSGSSRAQKRARTTGSYPRTTSTTSKPTAASTETTAASTETTAAPSETAAASSPAAPRSTVSIGVAIGAEAHAPCESTAAAPSIPGCVVLQNIGALEATQFSEYEHLRIAYARTRKGQHSQCEGRRAKKTPGASDELAPELDSLVNAASRPFKCYRKPIIAFYENDTLGESLLQGLYAAALT